MPAGKPFCALLKRRREDRSGNALKLSRETGRLPKGYTAPCAGHGNGPGTR